MSKEEKNNIQNIDTNNKERPKFWFSTTRNGNIKLNRPDGSFQRSDIIDDNDNEYWLNGYKRAILYMNETDIWDVTGFAAAMDDILLYTIKPEYEMKDIPRAILLTTPQFAEKYLFTGKVEPSEFFTSDWTTFISHSDTNVFYDDKEAQLQLNDHILYGVAFKIDYDGSIDSMNIVLNNITDALLEKYYERSLCKIPELQAKIKNKYAMNYKELLHFSRSKQEESVFFWHEYEEYGCFSQWYPCRFTIEGIEYETAEQYMMSKKALMFGDITIYQNIMKEKDPKKCKDLGKLVRGFDAKRWDEAKWNIVYQGNLAKFQQNEDLKEILLKTDDSIIAEASPYDKIWGIGLKASDPGSRDRSKWKGQNLLGDILMQVRATIALEKIREDLSHWYIHAGYDEPAYFLNDNDIKNIRKLFDILLDGEKPENLSVKFL